MRAYVLHATQVRLLFSHCDVGEGMDKEHTEVQLLIASPVRFGGTFSSPWPFLLAINHMSIFRERMPLFSALAKLGVRIINSVCFVVWMRVICYSSISNQV